MKKVVFLLCCCLIASGLTVPVLAVDNYYFVTTSPDGFYQNSGNVITPELDSGYGLGSTKPANAPGSHTSGGSSGMETYGIKGEALLYPETMDSVSNAYAPTAIEDMQKHLSTYVMS